jgi:hypothetical protein
VLVFDVFDYHFWHVIENCRKYGGKIVENVENLSYFGYHVHSVRIHKAIALLAVVYALNSATTLPIYPYVGQLNLIVLTVQCIFFCKI